MLCRFQPGSIHSTLKHYITCHLKPSKAWIREPLPPHLWLQEVSWSTLAVQQQSTHLFFLRLLLYGQHLLNGRTLLLHLNSTRALQLIAMVFTCTGEVCYGITCTGVLCEGIPLYMWVVIFTCTGKACHCIYLNRWGGARQGWAVCWEGGMAGRWSHALQTWLKADYPIAILLLFFMNRSISIPRKMQVLCFMRGMGRWRDEHTWITYMDIVHLKQVRSVDYIDTGCVRANLFFVLIYWKLPPPAGTFILAWDALKEGKTSCPNRLACSSLSPMHKSLTICWRGHCGCQWFRSPFI